MEIMTSAFMNYLKLSPLFAFELLKLYIIIHHWPRTKGIRNISLGKDKLVFFLKKKIK